MFRTTITAALFLLVSSAFAQSAPPAGMVGLTKAEQLVYNTSCTTAAGLNYSCPKGKVVATTAAGALMCRPDPKVLPFAFKGEKPCTNEKVKVADAATPQ